MAGVRLGRASARTARVLVQFDDRVVALDQIVDAIERAQPFSLEEMRLALAPASNRTAWAATAGG